MAITSGTLTLLNSSEVEIGGNYSASQEQFLARFNDFYTQEEVTDWVLQENNLQLCVTTKTIQDRLCVLHVLRARRHPKSRRAWFITLQWNPFDTGAYSRNTFGAEPVTKVSPKNADIEDPDTWEPVLLRRPSSTREGRPLAFYEGGFNGYSQTQFAAYNGKRIQPMNSAFVPIANAPPGYSYSSSFTFRILTKLDVSYTQLEAFEFSTNNAPVSISHKGLVIPNIPKHCLYCNGFTLTEQTVNNVHCWSIEIQFSTKYHQDQPTIGGYVDLFLDAGYDARALAAASDSDADGKPITSGSSRLRKLLDDRGRPISEPYPLNGNGRELASGGTMVYAKYRYPHEANWANFPYLQRILVA